MNPIRGILLKVLSVTVFVAMAALIAIVVGGVMGPAGYALPHPSLALGTSEVSVLELTAAYLPFANGGRSAVPYAVTEIRTRSGDVIYRRQPWPNDRVVATANVRQMNDMLSEAIRSGTGKAARLDRPAAGKTGTSQDSRDAWFIGYTAELVTGVWFGNDDGTPMEGVTGGALPARQSRLSTGWSPVRSATPFARCARPGTMPSPIAAWVFACTTISPSARRTRMVPRPVSGDQLDSMAGAWGDGASAGGLVAASSGAAGRLSPPA